MYIPGGLCIISICLTVGASRAPRYYQSWSIGKNIGRFRLFILYMVIVSLCCSVSCSVFCSDSCSGSLLLELSTSLLISIAESVGDVSLILSLFSSSLSK